VKLTMVDTQYFYLILDRYEGIYQKSTGAWRL
jgi:hypothetical protein